MSIEIKIDSIKLVPTKELKLNDKNRNHHPQDQIEELARHYSVHGMRTPIIVSNQSGRIVAGNGRFLAAIRAGIDQIPVSYQDFETPEKEYAFGIADNGLSLWSELDMSGINNDLSDLGPDFNIDDLGLKDFTLDVSEKYVDKDPDEIPEVVEPKAKLGEIYKLGNHRLMCGDSTKIEDVEKLMNGEKADMVFTDPPYGMNLDTDYRSMGSKNNFKPIIGDGDDFRPELIQTLLGFFSYCQEVFLFGADYYAELIDGRNNGSWIVWDKRSHGEENIGTLDGSFGADFELCWSKAKHQRKMCRVIRNKGAFIKRREGIETMHPSQKPVEMVSWFFDNWGTGATNVVDIFGGSGSTLIACEKTNRKCFMMELDPHYIDVIITRWENFTGQKAELING